MPKRTPMESRMIRRRLKGKKLSPVRSLPTSVFRLGRAFPVTTPWNKKSPIGKPWSLGRHTGEDYACPVGMPVYALTWGKVTWTGMFGGWSSTGTYGNHVIVRTRDGSLDDGFCHLDRIRVKFGDEVRPGTLLGWSGETGNVSGPHLHHEVRPAGGRFGSDVDPMRVRRRAKR